ncbi:MAG: uracil-DNA glycosylase, partial [Cocleimonas sp.]
VWISRDLIIENNESQELVSSHSLSEVNSQDVTSVTNAKPENKSNNSALSILESLDDSSVKIRSTSANLDTNVVLEEIVTQSVDSAKLAQEDNFASAVNPILVSKNLLLKSSQHHVYASGSEIADWMIIGHSPEPFNGIGQEPFAGESGVLLNNMLRAAGLQHPRSQAYLLNVVDINQSSDTDRNTKLTQDLLAVIEKVKPKIILFMGQIAPQNLLNSSDPLIIMRSKVHRIGDSNIPCVVTYYPSYLLQKPSDKRKAWDDLKLAMSHLSDVS